MTFESHSAASRKTGPSTDGADQVHLWGHLPLKVSLAQSNAPRLGSILKRLWPEGYACRRLTHTGRGRTPDGGAARPCRHNLPALTEGYELLGWRSSPAEREGASKDIGHGGNGQSRAEAHVPPSDVF